MKNKILSLLFWVLLLPGYALADNFVNLTPLPRTMTVSTGELVLPGQFVVSTQQLPEDMVNEAKKFVKAYNFATQTSVSLSENVSEALFQIKQSAKKLDEEGYIISVTEQGVTIEASTALGLYYAFQSIKKMLPPNVMAGVQDSKVTHYALPIIKINDEPNYGYRGFMLDTSRHFFSVEELKRVLEVMSYYKMNRFHWHMTDDQGWRVEIKKYPRLTSYGSISDNSYMVDMMHGDFWLNRPYGPLFYTQEDVKEVVAYAQERHIEIVPEIDMPGHFCAAMAAYPEFSCDPDGPHRVVSNIGGVYSDVLNVANPKAVQFAKDILTEIMDLFPGEYIHIGGDECPTTAWENNAECIAKKKELGLRNFRELQSHFIKDMAEHLKAHGRKISVWNEAISANGADTKTIKETGATVYCWTGADAAVSKAASLGLPHVYTPQIPWYINRKQSNEPGEPVGAGNGSDNLEVVYKQNVPANNARYFAGVQATFWSEYVAFGNYLEYLMLPRLVAIAEAGWTPKSKMNFSNFCQRITADSTLYNYKGYSYGKHYMQSSADNGEKVMPNVSTAGKTYWYRLVTQAGGERTGKCIELLNAQSPLLDTYQNKGAEVGRLWTNTQAAATDAAYDYQFWALEEDAEKPGHYALVCKALPEGSLNPVPTAKNNTGRWVYDNQKKHYNFILADNGYGKSSKDYYYYSIRCDQVNGLWLNAALVGQGYAVNLYAKPDDGNGGLWTFVPKAPMADASSVQSLMKEAKRYLNRVRTYVALEDKQPGYFGAAETATLQQLVGQDISALSAEELATFTTKFEAAYSAFRQSFGYLEMNRLYTLSNAVPTFDSISIFDNKKGGHLQHTTDVWVDNAWKVTKSQINKDFSQTVRLQNAQTQRFVGALSQNTTGNYGYTVNCSAQGADVRCVFQPETQDFIISINGKNIYPVSEKSDYLSGIICAGSEARSDNAIRPQGAAWLLTECRIETFHCCDEKENGLGIYRRSWPVHGSDEEQLLPPDIHNYYFWMKIGDLYHYARTAYDVTLICRDDHGALLSSETQSVPVSSEGFYYKEKEFPYYKVYKAPFVEGEPITLHRDCTFYVEYTSNALNGVKCLGKPVTRIEPGHSYVIYDLSPADADRKGFRKAKENGQIMRTYHIEDTDPSHTWLLEPSNTNYKVKNEMYASYVPLLKNSTPASLNKNGGAFTFSLNPDGISWKIKGTNGVCWDGLGNGALVGWNDPGHPYRIYEYFVQPYFKVSITAVDTQGKVLIPTMETILKAGDTYTLVTEAIEGYTLKNIQGDEALNAVGDNVEVKVIYEDNDLVGIKDIQQDKTAEDIYDLSGRHLQCISHKGIYIVNGRKILVK